MVKIESIQPGASATIIRGGERVAVFEKQLISYAEADTLEVTGGDVVYSVNEMEVITKSGKPASAVPPAAQPKVPAKSKATKVAAPEQEEPKAE